MEASYVGASTKRIKDVIIHVGKVNVLDIQMEQGNRGGCPVAFGHKIPLIRQDNTTSGGTIFKIRRGSFYQGFTVSF